MAFYALLRRALKPLLDILETENLLPSGPVALNLLVLEFVGFRVERDDKFPFSRCAGDLVWDMEEYLEELLLSRFTSSSFHTITDECIAMMLVEGVEVLWTETKTIIHGDLMIATGRWHEPETVRSGVGQVVSHVVDSTFYLGWQTKEKKIADAEVELEENLHFSRNVSDLMLTLKCDAAFVQSQQKSLMTQETPSNKKPAKIPRLLEKIQRVLKKCSGRIAKGER